MDEANRGGWARGTCVGLALALAGCASVPRSDLQTLEIEVVTATGAAVPAARCSLSNALGAWDATVPGKVTLSTDASALQLRCEAATGAARGELSVNAEVRGARWLRALAGGGVGALVGGAAGAADDAKHKDSFCCGNLGALVGGLLGAAIGSGVGAGTADPRYAYPARVRVVLQPVAPPR